MTNSPRQPTPAITEVELRRRHRFKVGFSALLGTAAVILVALLVHKARHPSSSVPEEGAQGPQTELTNTAATTNDR